MTIHPHRISSYKTTLLFISICVLAMGLGLPSYPVASYKGPAAASTPATAQTPSPDPTKSISVTNPAPNPQSAGAFAPDEVLVRFDPATPVYAVEQCLKSAHSTRKRHIAELNLSQLKVPPGQIAQSIASLKACPGVIYAERNYEVSAANTIPDDPDWPSQYGPLAIHAPQGWDLSTGSASVTIAIVDTGVDLTHVDLAAKIVPGYDFVNNDSTPQDDATDSHGTHVAGIAAAVTNNNIGVAGVSWGARIMPIKVLDSVGNGTTANVALGIIWAADHGAQVINLSLGGTGASSTLQDAVNYAYAKGVVIVAAAGNFDNNVPYYPADYPHVIAVAATDNLNSRASFSNFGPAIAVAAPGVAIFSTTIGDTYGLLRGTSMSSPFVAGLAAILRGLPTNNSPDLITWELEKSALDLGTPERDDYYGYGLIQVDGAIQTVSTFPLLVISKSGNGSGSVTSSPPGIDCGLICSTLFDNNASVMLTAIPSPGWVFTSWSDSGCPGTGTCTLTMDTNKSVTADFTYRLYLPQLFR